MSILNPINDKIFYTTLLDEIQEEWTDGSLCHNIIKNQQRELFNEKLNSENAWQWFKLILMTEVPHQMDWLETVLLKGVPIDKPWSISNTGHQVTVFDLIESVEGGINVDTRECIEKIREIYQIIFLRRDIQPALDILNELSEDKKWIQLNFILSCYVIGPLTSPKPLLHYLVTMERYDMVRAMLTSATELHREFQSDTYLSGWINMTDDEGRTVLHITAEQNRDSWAKWFVSNDADPMARDIYNKTPFHYAPKLPYIDVFWQKVDTESTALLDELLIGGVDDVKSLKWLLDNGANPNSCGAFKTALKNEGHVTLLVKYGGDPTMVQPDDTVSSDIIVEWLCSGGSGGMNYAEMCIKHLTGNTSAEWICFLIALHNGRVKEASHWWNQSNDETKLNFVTLIKNIQPKSSYMKQYKGWLDKTVEYVKNK